MKKILTVFFCFFLLTQSFAQTPKKWTSGDIHEGVKKLNVLASVLYVAAHPDDENTRLIAYLANQKYANTAYLSMTRGDGGQNLIGSEMRELLGVIRTQELLAARNIDGGQQFFTRANDFGFSKDPTETFNIWDRNVVMEDAVYAIRHFQPDVIITRFSLEAGKTHGHHTASALLAHEAFDKAADKNAFPEQVKTLGTWQAKRLMFNTSWWFYGSRENFEKAPKDKLLSVDVGVYYPIKGKSNTEVAAESRSMHKCQGFGTEGTRGVQLEYLELWKGDMPKQDIFEGINTTWTRLEGGEAIGALVTAIDAKFRYDNPAAIIPDLLEVRKKIMALPQSYWRTVKLSEVETLIYHCLGLFLEATTTDFSAVQGDTIDIKIEAINRSNFPITLKKLVYLPDAKTVETNEVLKNNKTFINSETVAISEKMPYGSPFWLNGKATLGMYDVPNSATAILPELPQNFKVQFQMTIGEQDFIFEKAIIYKKADPVKGEVYRPFVKIPPVFVQIQNEVYIFSKQEPKKISVTVQSGKPNIGGMIGLELPKGWRCEPKEYPFDLSLKGDSKTVTFEVFPPKNPATETVQAYVRFENGAVFYQKRIEIAYDHIPVQTVLLPAVAKLVRLNLEKKGEKVGYIMGAGDEVPASLEQIGYEVTLLEMDKIGTMDLNRFDAIIVGVRAYNTVDALKFHQNKLLEYVKNGGTMIVQYNTNAPLIMDELGPFSFELSRDRVTVEEAEVRILKPEHPLMTTPNKITSKDFDGWVQERGLYFPNKWDEHYEAILSTNDPNEEAKDGGLLVTKYGKGYYIYTGYAWFRELPAGVAGAYRIFANLISIGK